MGIVSLSEDLKGFRQENSGACLLARNGIDQAVSARCTEQGGVEADLGHEPLDNPNLKGTRL